MQNELPTRKPTRLRNFDYSSKGAYFVTICTQGRKQLLSAIEKPDRVTAQGSATLDTVGEGLAPPARSPSTLLVGEGLAPPALKLLPCGEIAKEQLLLLEKRYPFLTVEKFVIMPDHIHFILFLHQKTGGASPSPTLHDVVCAFKSLTSRLCKQRYGVEKIFQRSCAEHIIRDREDYDTHIKYMYENPLRWYYNHR